MWPLHLEVSCTIITTAANELLRPIHERMPVILPQAAEAVWLDPKVQDPAQLLPLLQPYPADQMELFAVSPAVNSVRHESPECILPLDSP